MESTNRITLRAAGQSDQGTIRRMVVLANLYPLDLDWRRFLLAKDGNRTVGVGQIREHPDGCRELASVVVERPYRNRGIGTRLVTRLVEKEREEVFLCCREDLGDFYGRVGFQPISPARLPNSLEFLYRIEALGTRVLTVFRPTEPDLISMIRVPPVSAGLP